MSFFRTPIVVVLGATGAGKSKLALELASRFKGEIINADAMQMYMGLNIATNKVTPDEMNSVKHHMINMLDPLTQIVRVNDFRNTSLPIIEDLLSRNIIPFICGGTNYYIESLIWKILVDHEEEEASLRNDAPYQGDDDDSIATESLYSELMNVDPERASTLHRNERRKIYRSLQVYYRHGGQKKHSEFIADQRSSPGGSLVGGPLRYKNVCFLWVDSELSVLDERCDRRVDKMIERGLLKELEDFHREYNLKRSSASDYTIGIFQSIGFKEFHDYLNLTDEDKVSPRGEKLLAEGITSLKTATRRYARRQIRWIKQRLLNPLNFSHLPLYKVDSTDPSNWEQTVLRPSVELLEEVIAGEVPKQAPVPLLEKPEFSPEDLKKVFACETCDMQFKGIIQYRIHMDSKKHKVRYNKSLDLSGPFYSLKVTVDTDSFEESDRTAVSKVLKRISRGKLTTSDIIRLLKGSSDLDLNIQIRESGAKKHIEELKQYNVMSSLVSLNK